MCTFEGFLISSSFSMAYSLDCCNNSWVPLVLLWSQAHLVRKILRMWVILVLVENVWTCKTFGEIITILVYHPKKTTNSPETANPTRRRYGEILPKHNCYHNWYRSFAIIARIENHNACDELQAPFDEILATLILRWSHAIADYKTDEPSDNYVPKYIRLIRNQNHIQMFPKHLQKVKAESPAANHYTVHHWSLHGVKRNSN